MRGIGAIRLASTYKPIFTLKEEDLEESFIMGGGKGGQKVNKASNCVFLRHVPTGTMVKCHKTRYRETNRKIARTLMRHKLEERFDYENSRRSIQMQRVQRRKQRKARKYKHKHQPEEEG